MLSTPSIEYGPGRARASIRQESTLSSVACVDFACRSSAESLAGACDEHNVSMPLIVFAHELIPSPDTLGASLLVVIALSFKDNNHNKVTCLLQVVRKAQDY